jgi:hypothetical protein
VTLGFAGHTQKPVPRVFGKAKELALRMAPCTYQSTLYSRVETAFVLGACPRSEIDPRTRGL